MFSTLCEAEEEIALNGPLETEEEEPEHVKNDSDSSSDDDCAAFRKKDAGSSKPAAPKKTPRSEQKDQDVDKAKDTKNSKSKRAEEGDGKLLQKAESSLLALQDFCSLSFYRGTVKEKEWEKKSSQALEISSSLISSKDIKAAELRTKLHDFGTEVASAMDLLKSMRDIEPKEAYDEYSSMAWDKVSFISQLPMDCLASVLQDCGKKLVEARASVQI